ncbi:MAG TPA: hypothetical protein DIT64_10735 [Verrucomicrobiales bacterium]|nr:hypothetical protein [Verrucomicrobiales bacterium]
MFQNPPAMKNILLPCLLVCLPLAAQQTEPPQTLTQEQMDNVMAQLKQLEDQIQNMRGGKLSTVMARLQAGLASKKDALNLYFECDKLVNAEIKEMDRTEARRRQEMMEKRAKSEDPKEEGDFAQAVYLGLKYLVLTLEAHEARDEDFAKMAPKLQSYIQELVASAPLLKGRSLGYLNGAVSDRNPIVEAFQLGRYLQREGWTTRSNDFGGMFSETLLPLAKKEKPETLPALWDSRISAEAAFNKESMTEPEYQRWLQDGLPVLKWERGKYLAEKGPSKITGLADMLAVIKEFPGHADAPKWLLEMRQAINGAAPSVSSANLPPAQ